MITRHLVGVSAAVVVSLVIAAIPVTISFAADESRAIDGSYSRISSYNLRSGAGSGGW